VGRLTWLGAQERGARTVTVRVVGAHNLPKKDILGRCALRPRPDSLAPRGTPAAGMKRPRDGHGALADATPMLFSSSTAPACRASADPRPRPRRAQHASRTCLGAAAEVCSADGGAGRRTIKNTYAPEWCEDFAFHVAPGAPDAAPLQVPAQSRMAPAANPDPPDGTSAFRDQSPSPFHPSSAQVTVMDWDRFTDDDLVGAASVEVRHDGVASGVQAQTLSLLCPPPPHTPLPPHPHA
jgi:hypothetical protein